MANFVDLIGKQPTVNSIEDNKQKVTDSLVRKVEKITKTLSSARIKKLFDNATPLNKFIEKHKQESKQTQINDKATKVGKLESEDGVLDMLTKILGFMQRTYDEDKLAAEEQRNFAEEQALEKARKQKALLDALKGKKGGTDKKVEKEIEDNGGIGDTLASILNAFGGLKTALSALSLLAGFVASPLGVLLIGAVVAGTIGAWMYNQIKADPKAALEGKGGVGMAVAGLGSEGQLPSWDEEQKDKAQKADAEQVDKKGVTGASLKELEAKRDYMIATGDPRSRVKRGQGDAVDKIKAEQLDNIEAEIAKRKSATEAPATTATPVGSEPTSSPAAASASSSSATPAASGGGAGSQLNAVTAQNNDIKLQDSMPSAPATSESKVTNISTMKTGGTQKRIPPVRNQEETFQRMIVYSTRIV